MLMSRHCAFSAGGSVRLGGSVRARRAHRSGWRRKGRAERELRRTPLKSRSAGVNNATLSEAWGEFSPDGRGASLSKTRGNHQRGTGGGERFAIFAC